MVESLPQKGPDDEGSTNFMLEGLEEIFQQKETVNPRVKMLLMDLEAVDVKDLQRELAEFAKSIGATSVGQ